jgi:predicted TIM-barrel fold metal-dependent hydrolase
MAESSIGNENTPIADCHFHIVDPARFPLPGNCGYTPGPDETGTAEDYTACMRTHRVTHGLAVQPSGYGYDNSAMLDAIAQSQGHIKGIAVVPQNISEQDLSWLADSGVVGIRFNLVNFDAGGLDTNRAVRLLEQIRELGWYAQIQSKANDFPRLVSILTKTRVKVLLDHLARPDPKLGVEQPGFNQVLRLADTGWVTVKLSGAFRESYEVYPHADLDPFVGRLLAAYTPDNLIWGSDWPFLNLSEKPSYRQTMESLQRWIPEDTQRRAVLWDTPARMFNFKKKSYDDRRIGEKIFS